MRKPIVMMKIVLLAFSILASSLAAARPARAHPNDEDDRHAAVPGVAMMMDGDLAGRKDHGQKITDRGYGLKLQTMRGARLPPFCTTGIFEPGDRRFQSGKYPTRMSSASRTLRHGRECVEMVLPPDTVPGTCEEINNLAQRRRGAEIRIK